MKKKLIGALAVIIIIIIAVSLFVDGGTSASAVTVAPVENKTVDSFILASGTLVYREKVDLRPEVIGKVSAVPVKEGEHVKKGQVVVRINPETFKAELATQKANVQIAQIAIQQQKLTIKNLKNDWQRKKKLHDQGLIDAASYDKATNQLAIARTQLASRKEALTLNKAKRSKAQEQLDQTVVRSPLTGIITQVDVQPGETVIAGTTNVVGSAMMTIADPSAMYAEIRVDEADIAHVAVGQNVDVTAVAYPNAIINGKITFISTSATTADQQTNLSFKVKVLLDRSDNLHLRPGMSCRAQIHTRSSHDTLAVPVQAVLYTNADRKRASRTSASGYVFVVTDGHAEKRKVATGISNMKDIVITSGLKADENVITGPYQVLHSVQQGDSVTIATDDHARRPH